MDTIDQKPSSTTQRSGGDDAVAFTSGPQGAPFSAGVVHAFLAADRKRPLVATGISMGAVAAAAMRRVYQELEHQDNDDLEVKRWRWYQRYYQAVIDNPLGSLWNALPAPVDLVSETPPARDLSVPDLLFDESERARRHYYLLTKLAVWLANLPIRFSTIATLIVMYVRRTERYGSKLLTWVSFYWNLSIAVLGIFFHLISKPRLIREASFKTKSTGNAIRPLFGWAIYALSIFLPLAFAVLITLLGLGLYRLSGLATEQTLNRVLLVMAALGVLFIVADQLAFRYLVSPKAPKSRPNRTSNRSWLGTWLLGLISKNLDITKGLLHPYEIKRAAWNLFIKDAPEFVRQRPASDDVKALFVCAALEETDQIILKEEMPVVEALAAAVAIPGVLPPQSVKRESIASKPQTEAQEFQVIDGASVRANPLPAFFDWCKHLSEPELVRRLERADGTTPSLHVVYDVPTGYEGSVQDAPGMECPDIVSSAQNAIKLAKRRDTRQEVRQTNNLARLEWHRRQLPNSRTNNVLTIQADEIAPLSDIDLGNALSPGHEKLRQTVADGCRATLESLYRRQIEDLSAGSGLIPCIDLLKTIAPRRSAAFDTCGGLKAVCDRCTGLLEYRPAQNPNAAPKGVLQTYGLRTKPTASQLTAMFPQLADERQKVVFLGSGGVFRGAFHIGVLGALYQTELYPDLVIGASVGTLMGGALCRMTAGDTADAPEVLADLTRLFVHVDEKVALTFPLKNAVKQLGIRARGVRLSPSELARRVREGSKADPGYAATGAPPVLTDALSYLFTIPHTNTAAIASQFVAGHFSEAIAKFLNEVRRETLTSLEIRSCIMGVSLLEQETRRLLAFSPSGAELSLTQPYQNGTPSGRKVAFFGTTSFLNSGSSLLLGRDFLSTAPSWSSTQQGLCSSAFPAVFAPRMEADLMPGIGRTDRYFADGGMFDNLPFFPALEVLSAVQRAVPLAGVQDLRERLEKRVSDPTLIISAGLNEKPMASSDVKSDTMFAVKDRATTLSYESKTNTFTTSARKSIAILREVAGGDLNSLSPSHLDFFNNYVVGTVVSITPTDAAHINPTFAFCKSLKLRAHRVQSSIGDGCYRSLEQFSKNKDVQRRLQAANKEVVLIQPSARSKSLPSHLCPYFKIAGKSFQCPFTKTNDPDAEEVYKICTTDAAHP